MAGRLGRYEAARGRTVSREKTPVEVCHELVEHVAGLARYWDTVEGRTTLEKLNGLAFSILAVFDGADPSLPAFDLVPCVHPDDKAYHQAHGEDWYGTEPINSQVELHGLFCKVCAGGGHD